MSLPAIAPMPAHLVQHGSDPNLLRYELVGLIRRAIEYHPRSQQVALGPSEVGHPCARRLGYKMLGYDENPGEPNWKATVGTAIHAWLEDVMTADNPNQDCRQQADATRWVVEATVSCGELGDQDLRGHCDLFDRVTGTVVDWKTVGPTQLTKYRSKGPGSQYRAQAHLYGRGWQRRGQDVQRVAVMFLPRNGELKDAYWWSEPYDEQVALDALARANAAHTVVTALGDGALPHLATADAFCRLCPYFRARSEDLTRGCPGHPVGDQHRSQDAVLSLI